MSGREWRLCAREWTRSDHRIDIFHAINMPATFPVQGIAVLRTLNATGIVCFCESRLTWFRVKRIGVRLPSEFNFGICQVIQENNVKICSRKPLMQLSELSGHVWATRKNANTVEIGIKGRGKIQWTSRRMT